MLEKIAAVFSVGQKRWRKPLTALLFALFLIFTSIAAIPPTPVSALPDPGSSITPNPNSTTLPDPGNSALPDPSGSADLSACNEYTESLSWIVCPTINFMANVIDGIYEVIAWLLEIKPLSDDSSSPTYAVWGYVRDLTNVIFVIFILVVIFSHLTGFGLTAYHIQRTLPRIIVIAVLVNLSYIACTLLVDTSNILGWQLRGVFQGIQESTALTQSLNNDVVAITASSLIGGGLTALILSSIVAGGPVALFFLMIPILLGGLVSVFAGVVTIAARQGLVLLLVMISPLAIVCFLLPNTESWFKKWKDLLLRLLFFFPMFAVLFGASQLAGFAIIASAGDGVRAYILTVLGLAVMIFPLFFSWSLMKFSGTILGKVNDFARRPFNPLLKGATTWAQDHRNLSRARYMANNNFPGARLRNYLNYRKELRGKDQDNADAIVKNRAITRAERLISGGYDANKPDKVLRTNSYTRRAKIAANTGMRATTATQDSKNVITGQYDHYHNRTARDKALSAEGADAWLHLNRSSFTAENNENADFDYLTQKYIDFAGGEEGVGSYNYKKFILSSAGALGPKGVTGVLGQMINKADQMERRRRSYDQILLNKYGADKREFRNMFVGYYNDDDGWATDEHGNRLMNPDGNPAEMIPGELLAKDPSRLVRYTKSESIDGKDVRYYDMKDQQGKFVQRIYENDVPMMKEILSEYDIPINDNINFLYGILSGLYPEENNGIGLAPYSTTIGRALNAARYKEKSAGFGAQAVASLSSRHITNPAQMIIEMLDNIIKTGKAGNYNTQDPIVLDVLNAVLDPKNWARLFPEEQVMDRKNVNGESLEGLEYLFDANGNHVLDPRTGKRKTRSINPDEATYEQKMVKIKEKFLYPFAEKSVALMQRASSNTSDNQKPGTSDKLKVMAQTLEKYWHGTSELTMETDAFSQSSNFYLTAREMRDKTVIVDDDQILNAIYSKDPDLRYHTNEILMGGRNEPDDIIPELKSALGYNTNLEGALFELENWYGAGGFNEEQIHEQWIRLLKKYLSN